MYSTVVAVLALLKLALHLQIEEMTTKEYSSTRTENSVTPIVAQSN